MEWEIVKEEARGGCSSRPPVRERSGILKRDMWCRSNLQTCLKKAMLSNVEIPIRFAKLQLFLDLLKFWEVLMCDGGDFEGMKMHIK